MTDELHLTDNNRAVLSSFFEEARRLSGLSNARALSVLPVFDIASDGRIVGIVGSGIQVTSF